jgi:hypothetical protein
MEGGSTRRGGMLRLTPLEAASLPPLTRGDRPPPLPSTSRCRARSAASSPRWPDDPSRPPPLASGAGRGAQAHAGGGRVSLAGAGERSGDGPDGGGPGPTGCVKRCFGRPLLSAGRVRPRAFAQCCPGSPAAGPAAVRHPSRPGPSAIPRAPQLPARRPYLSRPAHARSGCHGSERQACFPPPAKL